MKHYLYMYIYIYDNVRCRVGSDGDQKTTTQWPKSCCLPSSQHFYGKLLVETCVNLIYFCQLATRIRRGKFHANFGPKANFFAGQPAKEKQQGELQK
jgi:hypothetical protein